MSQATQALHEVTIGSCHQLRDHTLPKELTFPESPWHPGPVGLRTDPHSAERGTAQGILGKRWRLELVILVILVILVTIVTIVVDDRCHH